MAAAWNDLPASGGLDECDALVRSAEALRVSAPELAVQLARRALLLGVTDTSGTVANTGEARTLSMRAHAVLAAGLVRVGRHTAAVEPGFAALALAETSGFTKAAAEIRLDLAACAQEVGEPLLGGALLRPVLEAGQVPPSMRAAALGRLVGCVAHLARRDDVEDALSEADRLLAADDSLSPDARRMERARLAVRSAAYHRWYGDTEDAVNVARDGLVQLDRLRRETRSESDRLRARLVLELVCGLLDEGELRDAEAAATPTVDEPVRATSAAAVGQLMLAVATRVHLPSGEVDRGRGLLDQAAWLAERHGLDAVLADALTEVSRLDEEAGRTTDALAAVRAARAAEQRRLRAVARAARHVLTEVGAGMGAKAVTQQAIAALLRQLAHPAGVPVSMAPPPATTRTQPPPPRTSSEPQAPTNLTAKVGNPTQPTPPAHPTEGATDKPRNSPPAAALSPSDGTTAPSGSRPEDATHTTDRGQDLLDRDGLIRRIRSVRTGERPVSLTLLRFEPNNDGAEPTRGPDTGIMVGLADKVRGLAPDNAELARPDGGELAVLLPDTTSDQAKEFAVKVRETAMESDWLGATNGTDISISTGVAQDNTTADEAGMLTAARDALTPQHGTTSPIAPGTAARTSPHGADAQMASHSADARTSSPGAAELASRHGADAPIAPHGAAGPASPLGIDGPVSSHGADALVTPHGAGLTSRHGADAPVARHGAVGSSSLHGTAGPAMSHGAAAPTSPHSTDASTTGKHTPASALSEVTPTRPRAGTQATPQPAALSEETPTTPLNLAEDLPVGRSILSTLSIPSGSGGRRRAPGEPPPGTTARTDRPSEQAPSSRWTRVERRAREALTPQNNDSSPPPDKGWPAEPDISQPLRPHTPASGHASETTPGTTTPALPDSASLSNTQTTAGTPPNPDGPDTAGTNPPASPYASAQELPKRTSRRAQGDPESQSLPKHSNETSPRSTSTSGLSSDVGGATLSGRAARRAQGSAEDQPVSSAGAARHSGDSSPPTDGANTPEVDGSARRSSRRADPEYLASPRETTSQHSNAVGGGSSSGVNGSVGRASRRSRGDSESTGIANRLDDAGSGPLTDSANTPAVSSALDGSAGRRSKGDSESQPDEGAAKYPDDGLLGASALGLSSGVRSAGRASRRSQGDSQAGVAAAKYLGGSAGRAGRRARGESESESGVGAARHSDGGDPTGAGATGLSGSASGSARSDGVRTESVSGADCLGLSSAAGTSQPAGASAGDEGGSVPSRRAARRARGESESQSEQPGAGSALSDEDAAGGVGAQVAPGAAAGRSSYEDTKAELARMMSALNAKSGLARSGDGDGRSWSGTDVVSEAGGRSAAGSESASAGEGSGSWGGSSQRDGSAFRVELAAADELPARKPLRSWAELESSTVVESPADDLFGVPADKPRERFRSSLGAAFAEFGDTPATNAAAEQKAAQKAEQKPDKAADVEPTYDQPIGPPPRPADDGARRERSATTIASLLTEALAAYQSGTEEEETPAPPAAPAGPFDSFLRDSAWGAPRTRHRGDTTGDTTAEAQRRGDTGADQARRAESGVRGRHRTPE